jgi:hypothetical protein
VCIERMLRQMNTRVDRAPKGMRRNVENETTWSKNQKTINWQVEWIRLGGGGKVLSKAMCTKPIGDFYAALREEERKKSLSDEERKAEKKRKAEESKQKQAKKIKSDGHGDFDFMINLMTSTILQDPQTTSWNFTPTYSPIPSARGSPLQLTSKAPMYDFKLYLLRPYTKSCFPKVLVPLDPAKPLSRILRFRIVLEFPTIYVLENGSETLLEQFMLEKDFCAATGQVAPHDSDEEMDGAKNEEDDDNTEDEEDEDEETTSSSGSDSDEDMEDGEVLALVQDET